MKILYLITGLRLGGAENQLLLVAKKIQQANHQVLVVAMEANGTMAHEFTNTGITVAELNISGVKTLWAGYKKLKSIVHQFSPDVIHSHMIHANLFARVFKLFNGKCKLISTAHNIKEGNSMVMAGYTLTRAIADWSTNVSEEAFTAFVNKGYFDPDKSSYLSNAIDTGTFDPDRFNSQITRKQLNIHQDEFVFFSAGRLHEQKNYQLLLKAFKSVFQSVPQVRLIIAGEGSLSDELKQKSIDLGFNGEVSFLGRRNDMPELMNMCDCFVLSSKYEGFGLVVGEAMAMKKPVIATNCGGVKEVMGGFGKLINVNDEDALTNAMIEATMLTNEPSYLNAARKHIENNYAVNTIISKWLNLYAEV